MAPPTESRQAVSATTGRVVIDVYDPDARHQLAQVALPEDQLLWEFRQLLREDPGCEDEAREAAREMRSTPFDDLDKKPIEFSKRRAVKSGKVHRRAPPNPFHSPKLGKWRQGGATGTKGKVEDPALQNNPLCGRLIVMIGVNSALLLVFIQALILNRINTGSFYTSRQENSNIGPSGTTLYDLGGLSANAIRQGEWIRMFWSMWMHSGWIHIGLNVVCQLQYFYMLEPDWGTMRTLLLFYLSAYTGNLLSSVCDPCKTTVGSSGGLFGLMGGVVPYCIEFWHSIPRPLCILIFSIIVLIVSLATGLSKATDTWAHLGGLVGGVIFGFATITTPAAFSPAEKPQKKQVRRSAVMRWLQLTVNPQCKCGLREWLIRLVGWALLILIWTICLMYIYVRYEYQPPGSLTYSGITQCCCCYDTVSFPNSTSLGSWVCMDCDTQAFSTSKQTWKEFCHDQGQSTRLLFGSEIGEPTVDSDTVVAVVGDEGGSGNLLDGEQELPPDHFMRRRLPAETFDVVAMKAGRAGRGLLA